MPITLNGTTGIVSPKVNALDLELNSVNVVERGSNANGEYVRFADGTQICTVYRTDLVWSTASNWAGTTTNLHLSTTSPSFPANFVSPETAVVRLVQINSSQLAVCDDSITQTWSNIRTVNTIGTAAPTAVRLLAVGRWF